MKSALLGTAAAVALVLGCGLTASVDAQQAAGSAPAPVEQPAGAPQDARASITPDGSQQRSAPAQREQVTLRDGATVTVLRPVIARGEQASGQGEEVVVTERARPPAWQVAAGGRLWAIDPATNELRTCKVHQTSTVGLKVLRCVDTSWK
jgi:hypothetical protein